MNLKKTIPIIGTLILIGCNTSNVSDSDLALRPPSVKSIQPTESARIESYVETPLAMDLSEIITITATGIGQTASIANADALDHVRNKLSNSLVQAIKSLDSGSVISESNIRDYSKKLTTSYKTIKAWNSSTKEVTIEVKLSSRQFSEQSDFLDTLKLQLGYPKFAVVIKDENGTNAKANLITYGIITRRFTKLGFEFIPNAESAFYMKYLGKMPTSILAKKIYNDTRARYLIVGNVKNDPAVKVQDGMKAAISLELEVIDGMNQQLIATINESQVGQGHSEDTALRSCVKKALDKAFHRSPVDQEILQAWRNKITRFQKSLRDSINK